MPASVQSQAVVDVMPHPARAVAPFKHNVGYAARPELLGHSQSARPAANDDHVVILVCQFAQSASLATKTSVAPFCNPAIL